MIYRPPEIEMIRADVAEFTKRKIKAGQFDRVFDPDSGLLNTKTANDWMKQEYGKPALKALFGSFWFEGELCILFADTNLGKSILAVQIGDSLTREYNIEPFANEAEAGTRVLYIDFELSSRQFETRYVNERWGSYLFADTFFRSQFNPLALADVTYFNSYNEYINQALEAAVNKTRAQVLIIDNITYMSNGSGHANKALELMKNLKALKTKHNLSLLVLAHTPKRDNRKPIMMNDLQGSKMLINFADSAFAIGQSHSMPGTRYLKQIKQRNQKEVYSENNICLISLENYHNFLRYKFEGYALERDHLAKAEKLDKPLLKQKVLELHQKQYSLRKIAKELDVHFSTVGRIVQEHKMETEG